MLLLYSFCVHSVRYFHIFKVHRERLWMSSTEKGTHRFAWKLWRKSNRTGFFVFELTAHRQRHKFNICKISEVVLSRRARISIKIAAAVRLYVSLYTRVYPSESCGKIQAYTSTPHQHIFTVVVLEVVSLSCHPGASAYHAVFVSHRVRGWFFFCANE